MKYYRPIEHSIISQGYGESRACIYPNGKVVGKSWLSGTCPVGSVDLYKSIGMLYHNGVDFSCPHRARDFFDIEADTKWRVEYEGGRRQGLGLDVFSMSPILLENFFTIPGVGQQAIDYYTNKGWYNKDTGECMAYIKRRGWHYDEYLVDDGQIVEIGDEIAHCGSTGMSSNDHLHRGEKIVTEDGITLDKNNGTYGAVNLGHTYNSEFVLDYLKKKAPEKSLSDHLYRIGWQFNGTRVEAIFENLGRKLQEDNKQ